MTDDDDYDHELVVWLREQLDADEERLQGSGDLGWITFRDESGEMRYTSAAAQGPDGLWFVDGDERADYASAVVVHREAERLADVRSKRRLIDQLIEFMEGGHAPWNETYLMLLALPYASRPGYQEKWRPAMADE